MYEIIAAFFVGLASFLSPCILPIVPGFLGSLAGSVCPDNVKQSRRAIFWSTAFFVLGFALSFALLGTLIGCLCSPGSAWGLQLKSVMQWAGAVTLIGFGVFLILAQKFAALNFQILLNEGIRGRITKAHAGYVVSWVVGATFAAAWTPCIGPLLGSVLALAASQPAVAYDSLLAYSLGLGIPFLIIASFFAELTPLLKHLVKYTKYFDVVMGGALIIIGISLLVNQFV